MSLNGNFSDRHENYDPEPLSRLPGKSKKMVKISQPEADPYLLKIL